MAFEGLTQRLQQAFGKMRGKGKLTEEDVKLVMREVDASGMPSGRVITARVSYVLSDDRYVQYGYVILGLRDVTAREGEGNDLRRLYLL